MSRTCSVNMTYKGKSIHISCPEGAKYDDFIKIAVEHFSISPSFTDFLEISLQGFVFDKVHFENYLRFFPNPRANFEIDIDYVALLDNLSLNPVEWNSISKRKKDDNTESVSVAKKIRLTEYLEESDADKSKAKRTNIEDSDADATPAKRQKLEYNELPLD